MASPTPGIMGRSQLTSKDHVLKAIETYRPRGHWRADNFLFIEPTHDWMDQFGPLSQFQVNLEHAGGNKYRVYIYGKTSGHEREWAADKWLAGDITEG